MKRVISCAFFIVFSFIMQCTVFRSLDFGGIVPNLLIVVTSSYGFMRGKKSGLLTGFFAGLLMDIFFGNTIGFYALIYMYIGYLNGIFRKMFYPEDIKLPMIMVIISDLFYGITCYTLAFLLQGRFNFGYYLLNIILPEMVYTIVVTCVLYPLILLTEGRMNQKEREGESRIV